MIKKQASTQRFHKIMRSELPLSCPMGSERLWDAHPRVYLPIEKTGRAICPYCGCEYVLKNDA